VSLFVLTPEIEDRDEVEMFSCCNIIINYILQGSIILVKSTKVYKVYFLTLNGPLPIFNFAICLPCTWATRVISQWHPLNIG
jgi:hypothetical protein